MPRTETCGRSLKGRVRAMLHGIALGDALGAPVEKLSAGEIRARYGRVAGLDVPWHRAALPPEARNHRIRGGGIVTDDTLMTLCLMELYAECGRHLDAWDMAEGMVRKIAWEPRWIPEMQREAPLIDRLFYPEKWIFQRHQLAGCDPRQGGIGNMVNCGAAMYVAPIGAVNACDPRSAYDEAIAFAAGHQESFGLEAAGVLSACVAAAFVPGADVESIVATALSLARDGTRDAIAAVTGLAPGLRGRPHPEVTAAFHAALLPFSPLGDAVTHTADRAGRVLGAYGPSRRQSIEELPMALGFALLNRGDFRASILDGINSGRDTDSIGVMIGAILGSLHGEATIDAAEAAQLDRANRMDLTAAADRFADTVQALHILDADRASGVAAGRAQLTRSPVSP